MSINFIMRITLLFFIFCIASSITAQLFPKRQSALRSGEIYKITVKKEGIYKLTKKQLDDLGINTGTLNPKKIKIFGNYGGSLPEAIAKSYPDDLIEMPIIVNGEEDGQMGVNDYVLFYAEGADKWKYDEDKSDFIFHKNIYSDNNFIFLKIDGDDGKRIVTKNIKDATVTFNTKTYNNYQVFEEDKYNLLGTNLATHGSGKLWVGDYIPINQERDLSKLFNFGNIDLTSPIEYKLSAAGRSESQTKLTLTIDDKSFSSLFYGVSFTASESLYASLNYINGEIKLNNNNPKITLKSAANDTWLDNLQIKSQQNIIIANDPLIIRNPSFAKNNYSSISYTGEPTALWDITDLDNIESYEIRNGLAGFASGKKNQELILFKESNALSPEPIGKISTQNLHSITDVDLVILYNEKFKASAEKLALHRKEKSGYKVEMVNVADVYNEFASGKLDPSAIRNFAKMIHDRSSAFKYMLLLGDGSYDYKGLVKNVPFQNQIPVYETDESLEPINAFPTDDYYALLGNGEGGSLRGALDINVGRLTVNTVEEANSVIDKIIGYETSQKRFGDWRLNAGFSADDEDSNKHMSDADDIAQNSFVQDPIINQQKVYLDAYKQENTPGGERYPDATSAINQNIEKGQLTWCYLGHGGPKGLAQERVVKLSDIEGWNNKNSPTLFVTATCSFAGYDDPSITSGGELALINPAGGAIGLLTTVRSVFANDNARLTGNVFKNLYKKEKGLPLTFGEIIRRAKNSTYADTTGDNTRKFTLLGDPSQRLALPQHDIILTKINGQNATSFSDTIGALDKLTLQGEIRAYTGEVLNNFTGKLSLTIFDKISTLKTLGNDQNSSPKEFQVYKNIIFKGEAEVVNGIFTIECIIPKDINYEIGNARLSFYADNNEVDAAGYFSGLKLGGAKSNNVVVDLPPKMQLFMNDEKFVYGGITNEKPDLLIKLTDDLGINTTGNSIGHDITAKLIGENIEEDFVLNDYYKAAANDYTRGEVRYPLTKLKPGLYKMQVKAWDISNNSVEGIIEFRVIDKENNKLVRVINYPNPFVNNTEFSFEHDLANTNIEIQVNIYSISGKLIKSIVDNQYSSGYKVNNIRWEGKDDFGSTLAKGIYIYKIIMNAPDLKLRRESDFGKLVKM